MRCGGGWQAGVGSTAYLVLWGTYDGDRRRWAVDVDGDSLLVKRANLFAGTSSLKFALIEREILQGDSDCS